MATLSSAQLRSLWASYRCNPGRFSRVDFAGNDRVWSLLVATPTIPAWELFVRAQEQFSYWFLESAGGTYKCRATASGTPSLHSYGLALDINPAKNPQRRPLTHNYPSGFISKLEGIRTENGKQVFAWGGRWNTVAPDAMHWQINCSAADLATGLIYPGSTPKPEPIPEPEPQPEPGDVMLPFVKGQRSEDVRLFKDRMNETFAGTTGLGGVGYGILDISSDEFGDWYEDATEHRVRDFLGKGFTGHKDGIKGTWVGGNQWNALELLWIKRKLNL